MSGLGAISGMKVIDLSRLLPGPYAGRAGHEANYLAQSGLLDLVGPETGPP